MKDRAEPTSKIPWLDEYESKLRAISKPPWFFNESTDGMLMNEDGYVIYGKMDGEIDDDGNCDLECELSVEPQDADFIASSPEMVAKLIAAVRVAEETITLAIESCGCDDGICDSGGFGQDGQPLVTECPYCKPYRTALAKIQNGKFEEGE